MASAEISKFFDLSDMITVHSAESIRRQAVDEAKRLKAVLSSARIRYEESGEHVNGTGVLAGYAPRRITAYGLSEQFSRYSTEISNTVRFYRLKEPNMGMKEPVPAP
ncbi:MAG: hypothetical protein HY515_01055 [Candidatus Aenigmarchaeota archaeon]|nr:hypothetical protein [Candidatus Aenigmarchaeota archaeon]